MKILRIVVLLILLQPVVNTHVYSQVEFGANGSYIFDGNTFGLGLKSLFNLNENIAGSIGGNYYFNTGNPWDINLDIHYRLIRGKNHFIIYPISGLNIANKINFDGNSEMGLNLGLFTKININRSLVYIEPKYTLGSFGSFILSAGIIF